MKECGIEKLISAHCARHGFATMAITNGMPIESVSKVLGHTNIVTTQIYAKITTQKLDTDLTMLGNRLNASLITSRQHRTMGQRNIIEWSECSEYRELTIPSGDIWMSESELVDLFGVFIPKQRNTIKALYKEEMAKPYKAERIIRDHKPFEIILTATKGKKM